ncbi:MAG: LuxR C-terminal-related transcriptional regulator [Sulfitobacter sp.]|nr:LuxR C-terminal-related transcriptional regulator [Sulfitobacter sp.]
MSGFWVTGVLLIAAIAAAKTVVVGHFLLDTIEPAVLSGLFALFAAMTTGVAYLAYTQLRKLLASQRRKKLAPGADAPIAKETVISRYAPDWGLSRAEADVAIFVAKGFSNGEVAEMRGCAVATVKSQLGSIYQKSGLESRYQLISFVTDEVLTMADEEERARAPRRTLSILPLPSRRKVPVEAAVVEQELMTG